MVLLGFSMISNIATATMVNNGTLSAVTATLPEESLTQLQAVVDQLITSSPYLYIAGIIERIFAIILQISFSVIVWYAAKNGKKIWLWPFAVLIHAAVDGIMAIVMEYTSSIAVTEAVIGIMAVLTALGAVRVWRSNAVPAEAEEALQTD